MKPFCHHWRQLMLAEQDQALGPQDLARLESHIGQCADCREQRLLLSTARQATAPLRQQRAQLAMPAGLTEAINRQIAAERAKSRSERDRHDNRSLGQARLMRYATSLATIILLVALVVVYRSVIQAPQSARTTAGVMPTTTALVRAPGQTGAQAGGSSEKSGDLAAFGQDSAAPMSGSAASSRETAAAEATGPIASSYRASSGVTASTTAAAANAGASGFRLYTGTLAELDTLVGNAPAFRLPAEVLASAPSLRILTSPADASAPIRQAVILAGYPAADAGRMAEIFGTALPTGNSKVSLEVLPPAAHPQLASLFGEALQTQLLPTEKERQLTYIMITIGGQGLGQGQAAAD